MTDTDQSLQNALMSDERETDLENTRNIVSEHVGHENICIVSVTGPETNRNVVYHVQIAFK